MDLSYSPKHKFFSSEVSDFFAANVHFYPKPFGVNHPTEYARTIPKQYGGFGAEPDILKSLITVEEFGRFKAPKGLIIQGISMFVPPLLEMGSEEQKRQWVAPNRRGEMIWCQGYSEPEASSDSVSLKTSAV